MSPAATFSAEGGAATALPLRTVLQAVFIAALRAAGFPDAMAAW
jgi:hypothetical protein